MTTDNKVVPITPSIFVDTVQSREPDAALIEKLKSLLAEAETGRLRGLAWAAVDDEGWQRYSWGGACKVSLLISATSRLWFLLLQSDHQADD